MLDSSHKLRCGYHECILCSALPHGKKPGSHFFKPSNIVSATLCWVALRAPAGPARGRTRFCIFADRHLTSNTRHVLMAVGTGWRMGRGHWGGVMDWIRSWRCRGVEVWAWRLDGEWVLDDTSIHEGKSLWANVSNNSIVAYMDVCEEDAQFDRNYETNTHGM